MKSLNVTDWKGLKRLLKFAHSTIDDKLNLFAESGLTFMPTWVDASYAVHPKMKSHTGRCVSLGREMVHCRSTKQKINTKNSTEAKLIGASYYLPFPIWAQYFLEEQGYNFDRNNLNQYNMSTMKFKKNGKRSNGPNTRHIHIRYFFMKAYKRFKY